MCIIGKQVSSENNTQLLKGVLEFCVLKLIGREPTCGYEIVMHLKQVRFSDLSESTLYPLLLLLEQQWKGHGGTQTLPGRAGTAVTGNTTLYSVKTSQAGASERKD